MKKSAPIVKVVLLVAFLFSLVAVQAYLRKNLPRHGHGWGYANIDIYIITHELEKIEDFSDTLRWWYGSWIKDMPSYYRPMTMYLYLIEWRLFGPNSFGWHSVSFALHLLVVLAVFGFAGVYFRSGLAGFGAGLLFAVPLGLIGQTSQIYALRFWPVQNDQLCGIFYLTSLIMLILGLRKSSWRWVIGSLATFFLAIASKEMAYTLAPIATIFVLSESYGKEKPSKIAWMILPFWLLLGLMWFLRWQTTGVIGAASGWHIVNWFVKPLQLVGFVAPPILYVITSRDWWVLTCGLLLTGLFLAIASNKWVRQEAIYFLLAYVAVSAGLGQVFKGNWGHILINSYAGWGAVVRLSLFLLVAFFLWEVNRKELLALYGMVFCLHLHMLTLGPGCWYLYLPSAGWAVIGTLLVVSLWKIYKRIVPRPDWLLAMVIVFGAFLPWLTLNPETNFYLLSYGRVLLSLLISLAVYLRFEEEKKT